MDPVCLSDRREDLTIDMVDFIRFSVEPVRRPMDVATRPSRFTARFDVMVQTLIEQELSEEPSALDPAATAWKNVLCEQLDRTLVNGNGSWSRALMAVAWIHLLAFFVCHEIHNHGRHGDLRHLLVWFIELVAVFLAMRVFVGKGWLWSPPAIHFLARLWLTLLILSFSLSTLNATIGWETLWYKAAWGTLSSFFFATLAWLITPRFLILAVQMYLSALLMARFMDWSNLIYGVSWWLALMEIAWTVRRREREGRVVSRLRQQVD
jgi:hypothetical protein